MLDQEKQEPGSRSDGGIDTERMGYILENMPRTGDSGIMEEQSQKSARKTLASVPTWVGWLCEIPQIQVYRTYGGREENINSVESLEWLDGKQWRHVLFATSAYS